MDVTLAVESGRPTGSRNAGRLRAAGKVPGVVYGLGTDPVPVTVEWPELRRALSTDAGVNALIDLSIDEGSGRLSVVKEVQRDPVKRSVTHVDFLLIDSDAPLAVDVPLALTGTSPKLEAVKGIVEQLVYTLTIKAKPGTIPNQIDVDVSDVELGGQVKVVDVVLPPGVTCDLDPDLIVAQGSPTRSTIIMQQEAAKARSGEGDEADGDAADEADEG